MTTHRPVALITGGAKRLGRCLALRLAREGWDLVINYRSSAIEATQLVGSLEAEGAAARAVQADISDSNQVQAMLAELEAREGRLDLLVNNVGNYEPKPIRDLNIADWDDCLAANLSGAF